MAYEPKQATDHETRGVQRLLSQFRNKYVFSAVLSSYLRRVQELENACWEVILTRNIRDGSGVILDSLGRIVGRQREGLEDDDYKIALRAQIRINRTQGKPEDVIDVARLSLPDGVKFVYTEHDVASIFVEVLDQVVLKVSVLFRNLRATKAGGVRLFLIYSVDPPGEAFMMADYNPADPQYLIPFYDLAHGLGWESDPTMGGKLVAVQGT
jgi:hypothetical protein